MISKENYYEIPYSFYNHIPFPYSIFNIVITFSAFPGIDFRFPGKYTIFAYEKIEQASFKIIVD